ncbi:hypothetical protein CI102_2621 [Trichoderma harzianum]|nr:hypothetical protein CI102_2621 [Trichoderma harzianum]
MSYENRQRASPVGYTLVMARQNAHSRAITHAVALGAPANNNFLEQEVLVLFTSRHHHFVLPAF